MPRLVPRGVTRIRAARRARPRLAYRDRRAHMPPMADLYLKNLESERRKLWGECRLKGLPRGTPQRERIEQIDEAIAAHKAKKA